MKNSTYQVLIEFPVLCEEHGDDIVSRIEEVLRWSNVCPDFIHRRIDPTREDREVYTPRPNLDEIPF